MPKAIVIGGGFGGMASALRLRAKGYDVTLIEKQKQLGGRGVQFSRNGFVFDAGPTVITAPFLLEELWGLFGKKFSDYVTLKEPWPWYRVQFADGSTFDYGGTIEQMEEQIRLISPDDVAGYRKFLAHSKKIFDVGFVQLGDQPFHQFSTMLKCVPAMVRLGAWRTVWQMASKYFKHDKLRRVFSFQPLLVGGNPFTTTSIYTLIHYLEREWGVHFAMGGTGALVRGMEKLMREEGIEIRLGEEVKHIGAFPPRGRTKEFEQLIEKLNHRGLDPRLKEYTSTLAAKDNSVWGVNLSDEALLSQVVVCNADAPFIYERLLDPRLRRGLASRRISSKLFPQKYSMGLFVLYFGTTRKYPDVKHHTIILGESYKELLRRMFNDFDLETKDLSVYVHRPTATDPSMAPEGCDSWYVLVPVPNLQGKHDWSTLGKQMRDATVEYLERTLTPGLSDCICEESFVTPEHFAKNLNTLHGTGFSIQPIFSQSAWFRFHNKAPGIEGLYFVGAATHPGAGVPGVLCSAKLVDRLIPSVKK